MREARDFLGLPTGKESLPRLLEKKWKPFLEGIEDERIRTNTAILLENESQHLQSLTEDTTKGVNVGEFTKFVFPIVRKVFPNLLANQICSVQPMPTPVSAIFFFNYKYGTSYAPGGINEGDNLTGVDGKFSSGYSTMAKAVTCTLVASTIANAKVYRGTLVDAGPAPVWNVSQRSIKITTKMPHSPLLTVTWTACDDGSGNIDAWDDATGTTYRVQGTIDYKNGNIVVDFVTLAPASSQTVVVNFTYETENVGAEVKEINMDIQMLEVRAQSKKLKGMWSTEAADDLKAFHGMDAEAELVAGIASEIQLEVDRGIVENIAAAALGGGGTSGTWSRAVPKTGVNEEAYLRSLVTVLSTVSAKIHRKTLRGLANWLVAPPEVCALLESLPEFVPAPDDKGNVAYPGIIPAGTLAGKWKVYRDPLSAIASQHDGTATILMGYKGPLWLDCGYVYAPYVPLQVTPTFLDPNDFSFKKGLRTRYAEKLVRPEFFGAVTVTEMNKQFAS